jgi:hypothetical protein
MDVGVNPDVSVLVGLTVVLCFHQFFEGIGLGTFIGACAGLVPRRRLLGMAAAFSLSVPVGIFAGVGVSTALEGGSGGSGGVPGGGARWQDTQRNLAWVLGSLNGVAGGMCVAARARAARMLQRTASNSALNVLPTQADLHDAGDAPAGVPPPRRAERHARAAAPQVPDVGPLPRRVRHHVAHRHLGLRDSDQHC